MIEIIKNIAYKEDKKTLILLEKFQNLNKPEFFNKPELLEILKWKSPRPLKYYLENKEEDIIKITSLAFNTQDEALKIHTLTALNGVNIPAASAILMFYDSKNYPVIDIRVWQQLYENKLVTTNSKGQNFKLNEWAKYLDIIRKISNELNVEARNIEKRIFDYDRTIRKNNLYQK